VCVPVSAGVTFASNGGTERPKNQKLPGGLENPFRPILTTLGEHTVDWDGAPGARVNVFLATKSGSRLRSLQGRRAHAGRPSALVFPPGATVASAVHGRPVTGDGKRSAGQHNHALCRGGIEDDRVNGVVRQGGLAGGTIGCQCIPMGFVEQVQGLASPILERRQPWLDRGRMPVGALINTAAK
jgi:hypothetical protein